MPANLAGSSLNLAVLQSPFVFPLSMVVGGSSASPSSLSKCSSVLSFGFMPRASVVRIQIFNPFALCIACCLSPLWRKPVGASVSVVRPL